ncbi:MAG: S41 family peptidase [Pseudomonadota bacterium]
MKTLLTLFASLLATIAFSAVAQERGYYQSPDLHDDMLVFVSEGDLWRASLQGGTAVRLTTHPEAESSPILSPDGKWIAFMASYDGPLEVYLVSVTGGAPKRLTHEGGGVSVRGWMDNDRVIYRTTNLSGRLPRILRTVDRQSLTTTDLPFDNADQVATDAPDSTLFFTRYGLSMFADNAVLYRGGRMAQLWRGDLTSDAEAQRLLDDFGAPIRDPMFHNDRVYFVSDKSGADNIWSVDTGGNDPQQHTSRTQWQLRTPAMHDGTIVFQSGADLFAYEIESGETRELNLFLMSDGDYRRDRWIDDPLAYLEAARMNPDGDAVVVTARGRFASAFTGQRRRIDHRFSTDIRARSAAFSHDGESIYAILDQGDRGEIWQFPANGQGTPRQLTEGAAAHIWGLAPSPHSDTLIYADKNGRLLSLTPETGAVETIDTTTSSFDAPFEDLAWSSGGRYLAYTFYDARNMRRVAIYDTRSKRRTVATTGKFESFAPAFSPDGAWLYFISDRNFNASPGSPWGDRNMGPAFRERGQVFALQLDEMAAFPFHPESELVAPTDSSEDEEESEEETTEPDITYNGLAERLFQVPIGSGDFGALAVSSKHLFVYSFGESSTLKRVGVTFDNPTLSEFAGNVQRFELSSDGSKIFIQTGGGSDAKFFIVPSDKDFPSDPSSQSVRLSDWKLRINPQQEWRQLITDAWRLHRDFAYDPNLRDVDWQAVRSRYIPLRDRLGHRTEVDDLLKQMAAELGILHSQIRGGDVPEDRESGTPSFLGATYTIRSEGLEITSIYRGEPDRPVTLGPLQQPGIDVRVGDILQSVNSVPVRSEADLADALMMKAGEEVLLALSRDGETVLEIVKPRSRWQVQPLHYYDWVERNRARVATESDGSVGYLHLRAMGGQDAASFARDFFEHFDKDGLIIDVRGNSGGNVDSIILSTLLRQAWAYWRNPAHGDAYTNMQQTFRGHLAVLINEGTYSDGETFAAGIKTLGLGATIGTRTAGAGIWLSDRNRLSDGGQARVAEYAQYGADGRWLIEGRGVSPDIEIINPPRATFHGEDAQLAHALSYLRDKIAAEPIPSLEPDPLPSLGETGQDVN